VSASDVALSVQRFAPGAGSVLVTSGIPLRPGVLRPGQERQLRLVLAGTEVPVYAEGLTGLHPDGSLRAVLLQFNATVGLIPISARLSVSSTRPTALDLAMPALTTRDGRPAAVAVPTTVSYLIATDLVGATISSQATAALGGSFSRYESDFAKFADQHWTSYAADWAATNYYDRVLIYYAWWVRTGDPKYFDRADQIALDYRKKYLELNGYSASPHWAQLEGLQLHYLLTGDPKSKAAVAVTAQHLSGGFDNAIGNVNDAYTENRIQARVIQSYFLAWRLGDTSMPWATKLDAALTKILNTQGADGSYRFQNTCYHSLNYMAGQLNDQLIKHYTYYKADPRIPGAVQRSVDFLWTQWLPASQGLQYDSGICPGKGDLSPAPDLNNLMTSGFAWTYARTGNRVYQQRADSLFRGGVANSYLQGTKQFNESYTSSFHYLAWR
jgi:hypothetical protein